MENTNNDRRSFIRKAALGGIMAVSIPEILSASMGTKGTKMNTLLKDFTILFQGDSITDSGRNKEENSCNNARALGSGYPICGSMILNVTAIPA